MGCIYNSWEGKCQLWNDEIDNPGLPELENGICVFENDPDPSISCDSYESDDPEEEDEDEDEDEDEE